SRARAPRLVECEVTGGLEQFAVAEALALGATSVRAGTGAVRFRYAGPLAALRALRTVRSAYVVLAYDGARPAVVLSDARVARVLSRAAHATGATSFSVSAAGGSTPAMLAIRALIASATGL